MKPSPKKQSLIQKAFASLTPAFRGTIWQDALSYKLVGKAYESIPLEQNQHFWIKSARHLTGPLMALNDPEVRMVFIIGATQCLKTIAGDLWTIFVMVHNPRNLLVLFETDDKARDFCNIRLMEVIKKHPVLKKQIAVADRHDVTKKYIKLAGMDLKADGLNDSNLSTFSWPYIRISEVWQTGKTGMLKKAFKRADRFPDNCKILCESQAGLAGDDLHTESSAAHQVPLTWACPHCGGRQSWECTHEFANIRGPEFVAIKPKNAKDNWEAPKPGSYSGMRFEKEGTIDERARTATWECHFCGSQITDTKENRMALMDSYQQEYRIKQPDGTWKTPKQVCFILPRESMWDNTFETAVKSYLVAKDSFNHDNPQLLEDWYMSERAVFYSDKKNRVSFSPSFNTVDPTLAIPNEAGRGMAVDCQKSKLLSAANPESGKGGMTGHFWVVAHAWDKLGNQQQLWRGYCTSWQEWILKAKELQIPPSNIVIDTAYWRNEVIQNAAANAEIMDGYENGRKVGQFYITWTGLIGDNRRSFKHDDGNSRDFSKPEREVVPVDFNGKTVPVEVNIIRWSNHRFKDQLLTILQNTALKMPGKVTLTALPLNAADPKDPKKFLLSDKTREMEVDSNQHQRTWESQMSANVRTTNPKTGMLELIECHSDPHYFDCVCGILYLMKRSGMLGAIAPSELTAPEVS